MKATLILLYKKAILFIVWLYVIVVPIYARVLPREVEIRAGIIWIVLVLAIMYEFHDTKAEAWGRWDKWKIFREGDES